MALASPIHFSFFPVDLVVNLERAPALLGTVLGVCFRTASRPLGAAFMFNKQATGLFSWQLGAAYAWILSNLSVVVSARPRGGKTHRAGLVVGAADA